MRSNYICHHGIKGMHWGVRRYQNYDGTLKNAKRRYKQANKDYSKAYNKAYNFSARHPVSQFVKKSKNYSKSNENWENVYNKAQEANKAKAEYKQAKTENKSNKKGLTDGQKKALIVGSAVVGTALAAYGANKLINKGISKKKIAEGQKLIERSNKLTEAMNTEIRYAKESSFASGNYWTHAARATKFQNDIKDLEKTMRSLNDEVRKGKYTIQEKKNYIRELEQYGRLINKSKELKELKF